MMNDDMKKLNGLRIGIVGCGHLGQAIARTLVSRGFEKSRLLISYRGNPQTRQRFEKQELAECLTTNERLFQEAELILLTVKPQDIRNLGNIAVPPQTCLVSCAAGVSAELLNRIFRARVIRLMLSGPDTILDVKGAAAMYPEDERLGLLLRAMGLMTVAITTETALDVFTAGVCLPAAILKAGDQEAQTAAIARIAPEYPLFAQLYDWAVTVLPEGQTDGEKADYISKMATGGGVTEAIIRALENGEALDGALKKGIGRIQEISAEIRDADIEQLS